MIFHHIETKTLEGITVSMIETYLQNHDWQFERAWFDKARIWTYRLNPQFSVRVPQHEAFGDYLARVYDVVHKLAQIENRSQQDVLDDLHQIKV